MTKDEILRIKEHIEIHARREPRAIKITEIMWKAVGELERIAELEKKNERLNICKFEMNIMLEESAEENAELKTKVTNLQKENKLLGERCNQLLADKGKLTDENTELKEKLEIEQNAKDDWFGKAVTKDRRLTEAKELLRAWLQIAHKNHARCYGFVKDTEQFLEEK